MKREGSKRTTTCTLGGIVLAHSESFQHSSLRKDFLNIFLEDNCNIFLSVCAYIYVYINEMFEIAAGDRHLLVKCIKRMDIFL